HASIPKRLFLCLPYGLGAVHRAGLDVEASAPLASGRGCADGVLLVCAWFLVRLGLLCLHRLALSRARWARPSGISNLFAPVAGNDHPARTIPLAGGFYHGRRFRDRGGTQRRVERLGLP